MGVPEHRERLLSVLRIAQAFTSSHLGETVLSCLSGQSCNGYILFPILLHEKYADATDFMVHIVDGFFIDPNREINVLCNA